MVQQNWHQWSLNDSQLIYFINHFQTIDAGPDPTKAPCKKAKQLRKERKLEKLKDKGIDVTSLPNNNKNIEKQLEDFINELPDEFKQKLEVCNSVFYRLLF